MTLIIRLQSNSYGNKGGFLVQGSSGSAEWISETTINANVRKLPGTWG